MNVKGSGEGSDLQSQNFKGKRMKAKRPKTAKTNR